MRWNSGSRMLSAMMLLTGIAALVLRRMLYMVAVDGKGLLLRGHPLTVALAALTVAALLLIVTVVRKVGTSEEPDSACLPAAFGNVAAGAGILATVLNGVPMLGGPLEGAWYWLGLAAPVCLFLAGVARAFGKRPFFLLHVVICLFFAVHIVTRYQLWSSNPQLQDYVFSLLGAIGLMFFGFYTAARGAGCGNYRMRLGMGLAAIYLCLAELGRSANPALYLGGLLWVLSELYSQQRTETK